MTTTLDLSVQSVLLADDESSTGANKNNNNNNNNNNECIVSEGCKKLLLNRKISCGCNFTFFFYLHIFC